jgi:hypothetical protein
MRRILIAVCTLPPAIATAQTSPYTIEIHVDPPIIEPGESATIELRAGFDSGRDYAMNAVFTSLLCSTGGDPMGLKELIAPMAGPGTEVGTETIAGVEGILAGQLQFHSIYADPTNPIPFWRVAYHAPPDAGVGIIDLWTRTSRYTVYPSRDRVVSESRMLDMVDGSATLTIVACRADFNEDGTLDLFDFLAFMNAFDAGEALADFDFDGELTVFDFLAFQNRFDAGC